MALVPQIRLVVEEGLNQLPYTECTVTTPTGMWEITLAWVGLEVELISKYTEYKSYRIS